MNNRLPIADEEQTSLKEGKMMAEAKKTSRRIALPLACAAALTVR
jgi:hypothetical protein